MYKIINQLTNQEETFEHRDELLSRLEIINERMKSNKINGIYRLYSFNSPYWLLLVAVVCSEDVGVAVDVDETGVELELLVSV